MWNRQFGLFKKMKEEGRVLREFCWPSNLRNKNRRNKKSKKNYKRDWKSMNLQKERKQF